MRSTIVAGLLLVSAFVGGGSCRADIIKVSYAGTYTGSWTGNYSPFGGPPTGGPFSGTIDTAPFTLNFSFDTALAQPGFFGTTSLTTPNFGTLPFFPSVGGAVFSSALVSVFAGSYAASDIIGSGTISQFAQSYFIGKGGVSHQPIISMTASIPLIFDSILDEFTLSSNQPIGSGTVYYGYESTGYGGGVVNLSLQAYSIDVDVQITAVPEPSTWAMLLIGFAGFGYFARRRNRQPAKSGTT